MTDIEQVKQTLSNPDTYREGSVKVIQTATSMVFLTDKYAYKTNRDIKLSFLDYSTKEKRMNFIKKEYVKNKEMTPDLYLGLLKLKNGKLLPLEDDDPKADAYVIQMEKEDPNCSMDNALKEGTVTQIHIKELAAVMAKFHKHASVESEYGTIEKINFGWDELFGHVAGGREGFITSEDAQYVEKTIRNFIDTHLTLFDKRVNTNMIRFCHGDLHSGNVFLSDRVKLFDRITFNKRFPCCDVISELAFMAMDLDFHGKHQFSDLLAEEYAVHSNDNEGMQLLTFYKCFRAWIRGCINFFDSNPQGKQYFDLAKSYAKSLE